MNEEKLRCFKYIAKLIRTKRLSHTKRYSQSELSQILGYKNGQFISNVERGLCNIPLKMLHKVAGILDINHDELKESLLQDHKVTLENFLKHAGNLTESNTDDADEEAANVANI
jgi:transcriptional regulator with XRE-family HTH domain